jgi:hypothetical protein
LKKWLKEPLIHFLFIGAMIFVVFSIANKEEPVVSDNKIVVSRAEIERLSSTWAKKMNRPPTEQELQGLIDAYIKEEVYYREALALGLDKNDTILRRRLMQKMEFLSNDLAELNQPDETELNKYFVDNQDKYKLPARISFSHVYFSWEKRQETAIEEAKRVLKDLEAPRAPERGDRFMLEYDYAQETPADIARLFGPDFADQVFALETGTWQGPIHSSYGLHLVRISEKIEARIPEFASVIEKVRTDYVFENRQKMNKEIYERFKKRYEIVIEDVPKDAGIVHAAGPDGRTS